MHEVVTRHTYLIKDGSREYWAGEVLHLVVKTTGMRPRTEGELKHGGSVSNISSLTTKVDLPIGICTVNRQACKQNWHLVQRSFADLRPELG